MTSYQLTGYANYKKQIEENRANISVAFESEQILCNYLFSTILQLAEHYLKRFYLRIGNSEHVDVVTSTIFKSLHNLYGIMDLTASGQFGAARIIMRNVFEYLVIGKYALLSNDSAALSKWENNQHINVDRYVLKYIRNCDDKRRKEFKEFWADLCSFSHATRSSGQPTYVYDESYHDAIHLNYSLIQILYLMLYHFVRKYLYNKYYSQYMNTMRNNDDQIDYSKLEKKLSDTTKELKKSLAKANKDVLDFYSATWLIEPSAGINPTQNDKPFIEMQYIERKSKAIDIRNKSEIIQYLKGLIEIYSDSIADINDDYREIVLRYLRLLSKRVKEHSFPELTDKALSYAVTIEGLGVGIQLNRLSGCINCHEETMETILFVNCGFISIKQYASIYRVTERTVWQWISNKKIHHVFRDGKQWYISELQQRPTKSFYTVSYGWHSISSNATYEHKELEGCCGINIERKYGEKLFECTLSYTDDTCQTIHLSDEQRIKLEKLIENFADGVCVEENYPCFV